MTLAETTRRRMFGRGRGQPGFVRLRGRSRKFEGCREICETRGKTHKSGSADFRAGLRGISPSDRAQFNLGSRERL